VALEGEDTPRNHVNHLIGLAKDGNGKLTLSQIRWELQDKSITMPDVLGWFSAYAADVHAEPHPGNTLYLTFGQSKRQVKQVVNSNGIAVIGTTGQGMTCHVSSLMLAAERKAKESV
jgi:hypothetical protein